MIGDDMRGGCSHRTRSVAHMVLGKPTQCGFSPQPAPAARLKGAFRRPQAIFWNWENSFPFFASSETPPAGGRFLAVFVVITRPPHPYLVLSGRWGGVGGPSDGQGHAFWVPLLEFRGETYWGRGNRCLCGSHDLGCRKPGLPG